MTVPVLELRAISKSFGGVRALTDVSVRVEAGSVVALMGENGAGKSTLSSVAAGIIRADAGEIVISGNSVVLHKPADAERLGIRLIPQELTICPDLSVAENIGLGAYPRRLRCFVDRRALREAALARLGQLGITGVDPDASAGALPIVQQQCVQIARALDGHASVLIMDEPTGPMSADEVERFVRVVRDVASTGVAVIFVSHRLDEVLGICDRAIVLRDGALIADLSRDGMSRSAIATAMVGDRELLAVDRAAAPRGSGEAPVLSVRGLSAGAAADVTLDAYRGEVLAVYGAAGSGREVVGPAIVGVVPARAGTVSVGGHAVTARTVRAAMARGIGYVPAERRTQGLVLAGSVRMNLTLSALRQMAPRGVFTAGRERAFCTPWLRKLRVAAPSSDVPVQALSGGTQQKVLLARTLAGRCQVLLLEEPTRGVDVATKSEIWHMLHDFARDGAAVVAITSDVEEAATVGTRVAVMRRGRVAAVLTAPSEHDVLVAAMTESAEGGGR